MQTKSKTNNKLRLLSKSRAAEELGIGRAKLEHLIENGLIQVIHINGRIHISYLELLRFLSETARPVQKQSDFSRNLLQESGFDSSEYLDIIIRGEN